MILLEEDWLDVNKVEVAHLDSAEFSWPPLHCGVSFGLVTYESSFAKSPILHALMLRFEMLFGNIVFFPSFFLS